MLKCNQGVDNVEAWGVGGSRRVILIRFILDQLAIVPQGGVGAEGNAHYPGKYTDGSTHRRQGTRTGSRNR